MIVTKITKRKIEFEINNKQYVLNAYGVICSKTIQKSGKPWYSYADINCSLQEQIKAQLSNYISGYEIKNNERYYAYTIKGGATCS